MWNSSAFPSALAVLAFSAAAAAQVEGPPAPAAEAGAPEGPGRALVLPTRVPAQSGVDGTAVDLLLATALQDLVFEVRDIAAVLEVLHRGDPGMDKARAAYLDMRLEDALRLAREERERHLSHRGDLLRDPGLEEAELFLVQVLMDLGREGEAAEVADRILERNPRLRLDPAEYAPQIQALWASVVESRAGSPVEPPTVPELRELGGMIDVDWLVQAARVGDGEGADGLLLRIVPVDPGREASDHRATLGTRPTWGNTVRGMLLERFPQAAPEGAITGGGAAPDGPPGGGGGVEEDGAPWYRRWWFWTAVGVVVAGATAGAIGGYYANRDPGDPKVTADFGW